jgi:glycosyltransferase involved in cell wall biosynthesis
MQFSIIVTTYNGISYLGEQLDSLRSQTLPPDEVYIFDDKSTDGTQEFVQAYIHKYGLSWHFSENKENLGWKKNYLCNIPRTVGDVIFLCDQDDIWLNDKCKLMMNIMENTPDCNVLLSNYFPYVMPGGPPVSRRSRNHSDNRSLYKVKPTMVTMQATHRPGCTYCIRRTFFDQVIEYWDGKLSHDGFLYYMGLLTQTVYLYNYRSIKFRRHGNNNSPLVTITIEGLMNNIKQIESLMAWHNEYLQLHAVPMKEKKIRIIEKIQRGCKVRYAFLNHPSLITFFRLMLNLKVYISPKHIVRDMKLCAMNKNE